MSPIIDTVDINEVFTTPSDIDLDRYICVTYRVVPGGGLSLDETAALLAINTSLGTIRPLNTENKADRSNACAKVIRAHQSGQFGIIEVAYPYELCGAVEGIPQLLTTIWLAVEYIHTSSFWVVDVDFPKNFVKNFTGPCFGIQRVREIFRIPSGPILGTIVKPRSGVPLEKIISSCYQSLLGGADFVVDDELIVDPPGDLTFEKRVPEMVKMARRAESATGKPKSYVANINASHNRAYAYAIRAIEAGATALMANAFTMGFATFQDLAADSKINVPLFNCGIGTGILTRPTQDTGTADVLLARLSRMAGADAANTGIVAELWYTEDVLRASINALTRQFHGMKQSFPIAAGGLNVANLWNNLHIFGPNVILEAGSGILGFPDGPEKGARSFKKIIENVPAALGYEAAVDKIEELAHNDSVLRNALDYHQYRPKPKASLRSEGSAR